MIPISQLLSICVDIAFLLLSISFVLIVYRIVTGPTLPDRILALDMLIAVAIGFIATFGVHSGFYLYVDIAIALGLIGFLSTVAFARFVLTRGSTEDVPSALDEGRDP